MSSGTWRKQEAARSTPEWHAFYDHESNLVIQLVFNTNERRAWFRQPGSYDLWDAVRLPAALDSLDEAKAWVVAAWRMT